MLDFEGYTMPFSALPSCAIPVRHPHPESQNGLPLRCHAGASRLPWVRANAPTPWPTHKAGDPGIGKDPGKVSRGFSCRSIFLEQFEQLPVFRLRQETIEILQDGRFHFRVRTEFLHHAVT